MKCKMCQKVKKNLYLNQGCCVDCLNKFNDHEKMLASGEFTEDQDFIDEIEKVLDI